MKKLLSYLLTFAMVITIIIPAMKPAFAESTEETVGAGTTSKTVTIDITKKYTMMDVISVNIEWGSLEFELEDNRVFTYDPGTHAQTYQEGEIIVTTKEENGDKITVTNHSNVGVNVYATINQPSHPHAVVMLDYAEYTNVPNFDLKSALGAGTVDSETLTMSVQINNNDKPLDQTSLQGKANLEISKATKV